MKIISFPCLDHLNAAYLKLCFSEEFISRIFRTIIIAVHENNIYTVGQCRKLFRNFRRPPGSLLNSRIFIKSPGKTFPFIFYDFQPISPELLKSFHTFFSEFLINLLNFSSNRTICEFLEFWIFVNTSEIFAYQYRSAAVKVSRSLIRVWYRLDAKSKIVVPRNKWDLKVPEFIFWLHFNSMFKIEAPWG